jgi:two-component system, OmpR family, sensor kinase
MNHMDVEDRWRTTLETLLAIPSADLEVALNHACTAVGRALRADKVDAFLYDDSRDSLVALGTSATALSSLQKQLGLDVLQISNGGRAVYVFRTGKTFVTGRLLDDPEELRGVKQGLKIQSKVGVPLEIGGRRRGMIMIASLQPDFFAEGDVHFTESVARWVAIVAHRAELAQELTRNAIEHGRRQLAEELITVLAHDLRNYLTPISARLHLMQARAEKELRGPDVRDAAVALSNVARLSKLISDILDVARLDQGLFTIDAQPVDLGRVAREASGSLSTPDHEIALEIAEPAVVAADPVRLQQCIDNLLSNAIQHSPREAAVHMRVWKERQDARAWGCLEVRNQGPGIPSELLPTIFERFARGPRSSGLGIGLYLAERVAKMHGGDLTADSAPGRGARFRLMLPSFEEAQPSEG